MKKRTILRSLLVVFASMVFVCLMASCADMSMRSLELHAWWTDDTGAIVNYLKEGGHYTCNIQVDANDRYHSGLRMLMDNKLLDGFTMMSEGEDAQYDIALEYDSGLMTGLTLVLSPISDEDCLIPIRYLSDSARLECAYPMAIEDKDLFVLGALIGDHYSDGNLAMGKSCIVTFDVISGGDYSTQVEVSTSGDDTSPATTADQPDEDALPATTTKQSDNDIIDLMSLALMVATVALMVTLIILPGEVVRLKDRVSKQEEDIDSLKDRMSNLSAQQQELYMRIEEEFRWLLPDYHGDTKDIAADDVMQDVTGGEIETSQQASRLTRLKKLCDEFGQGSVLAGIERLCDGLEQYLRNEGVWPDSLEKAGSPDADPTSTGATADPTPDWPILPDDPSDVIAVVDMSPQQSEGPASPEDSGSAGDEV